MCCISIWNLVTELVRMGWNYGVNRTCMAYTMETARWNARRCQMAYSFTSEIMTPDSPHQNYVWAHVSWHSFNFQRYIFSYCTHNSRHLQILSFSVLHTLFLQPLIYDLLHNIKFVVEDKQDNLLHNFVFDFQCWEYRATVALPSTMFVALASELIAIHYDEA